MAVAEALRVGPLRALVEEVQRALHERSRGLVWRTTPQGLVADIAEGELLLTQLPETSAWKLTAVFQARPADGGPDAALTERGRRVIGWGVLGRMQQRAHELAMRGVPGGPAYLDGELRWYAAEHDGSLRMAVPSGELRISSLAGDLCVLTHEDAHCVELLDLGTRSELLPSALSMSLTRARRPLQIRVKGRRVNLRSIGVSGVLGYHEHKDSSLVLLTLIEGDILLIDVRGAFHRPIARLSWTDLLFGDAIEVQPPTVDPGGSLRVVPDVVPAARPPVTVEPPDSETAARMPTCSAPADHPTTTLATPLITHTPMNERHRELCQRYFCGLHQRLRGRGARKARTLVLLILEVLDRCREDITGSRTEVHARIARVLDRRLPGGSRNIRDCLDLLMHTSPFARPGPDKQCTLLFAQLHDPESELMRFIAAEDARGQPAANEAVTASAVTASVEAVTASVEAVTASVDAVTSAVESRPVPADEPTTMLSSPALTGPSSPISVAESATLHEPATTDAGRVLPTQPTPEHRLNPDTEPAPVEVFRQLGKVPSEPLSPEAAAPPQAQTETPPPAAPIQPPPARPPIPSLPGPGPSARALRGFTRTKTYFLGQVVDDDDDSDAPSRYRGHDPDESPPFLDLDTHDIWGRPTRPNKA